MEHSLRYALGAASLTAVTLVTACSGQSGVTPAMQTATAAKAIAPSWELAASPVDTEKRLGKARLVVQIPRKKKIGSRMHPDYISPSTKSMTVALQSGKPRVFNLTPKSPGCTTNATNGYVTCSEAMAVPKGQQTLTVTLYDAVNGKGHQLATATTSVKIASKGFTSIPIILGGVPATATVLIAGSAAASVPIGTPTSLPVTVEAYDADKNLIVPPGNYATPITLSNADTSGNSSFTAFATSSTLHQTKNPKTRDIVRRPMDVTVVSDPGAAVTLYYTGNGGASFQTTITPNVDNAAQPKGAATLSTTGTPAITEYTVPTEGTPLGIAPGPDGALWFGVDYLLGSSDEGPVGRIATNGAISEFPIGILGVVSSYVTAGPDHALWFTDMSDSSIIRVTTDGSSITRYVPPTTGSSPHYIVVGPDGALWFTEYSAGKIGRITTNATASNPGITEYPTPTGGSRPFGITVGPDGALWFTENGTRKIGRITTNATASNPGITEYSIPNGGRPIGIAAGPDGALWFTNETAGAIGRIPTSATASNPGITEYPIPMTGSSPAQPYAIAAGPDGALWFTDIAGNDIGRITTSASVSNPGITEYTIPTSGSTPEGITTGPDGALWFTECNGNKIGRLP